MHKLQLGSAIIDPRAPVIAGEYTTITYTYTTGHPIDDSGYIKIVFRVVSDCGAPQFVDPEAPNYCTVHTNGDCVIEPRWDPKGHTRPWSRALFLKVKRGYLDRGEVIRVVFGDISCGSPGWQMQTFCARKFEFKTLVDPIATYEFKELPSSPAVSIIPGLPSRAVCIAPSLVSVNNPFTYHLKLEDKWGNPTGLPLQINHSGWASPGIETIEIMDQETNLSAVSNPIKVIKQSTSVQPFWADFHGQSEETVGTNPIEDYFAFGRHYGLLDILGHQGNDFQVTDTFWDKVNELSRSYYKPGEFVTYPGYEWSGNTPLGGDRNIYFSNEGGQITRSGRDLLPGKISKFPDSHTVQELYTRLAKQTDPIAFAFAHVGGRYADIRFHDPNTEIAVEVHSAWGTFEWLVEEALQRGYRIGIVANSDGHKCRPGASYPGAGDFGSYGGLTCVLAPALDRQHIYQALVSRHFYATTGNRCLVDVSLETETQMAVMGDIIFAGKCDPHLHGSIVGTGAIENIEVRNGLDIVKVIRPYSKSDLGRRLKITWRGAEVRGRNRMAKWDGYLNIRGNTITAISPINFWNCYQPLTMKGKHSVSWQSTTTGGTTGMIITLEKERAGYLDIHTHQRDVSCEIETLGMHPQVWECGGVQKEIQVVSLPDQPGLSALSFDLNLTTLRLGDNPIYIRVTQEDAHMAWTSPIYLVKHDCEGGSL